MAGNEQLIADIMGVQERLRSLFAGDRAGPLFSSHLTMSQLRILMLLSRHGTVSGGELARLLGVGLAASSGMIDRLVAQDLVARAEDQHDRRVRRIGLTRTGARLIGDIVNAGEEKMRTLLSRLSAPELALIAEATTLLVRAAEQEAVSGQPSSGAAASRPSPEPGSSHPSSGASASRPSPEAGSSRPGSGAAEPEAGSGQP